MLAVRSASGALCSQRKDAIFLGVNSGMFKTTHLKEDFLLGFTAFG